MTRKQYISATLIIIITSFAIYANTFKNGFVYDDENTIVNNSLIKNPGNLSLLFDKSEYFSRSGEMSYRPVVTLTYFIDHALYGVTPRGYHLTNILLHAVNGVLFYFFLNLLFQSQAAGWKNPALFISLIFVSHPVLTEAVNCISYREDLLSFLFYMVTLNIYLILRQRPDHKHQAALLLYILSCLAYLSALLSKEMAATLPLIIICYEGLYGSGRKSLTSRVFSGYIAGYVGITAFYLILRFYLFYNPGEQAQGWGMFERFLTLPWLILSYLKLILFPLQLSADYVIKPVAYIISPSFAWPFISIVLLSAGLLLFRKEKGVFFGYLFFILTLLPVYNFIPISNPLAERYLYLPIAGFAIMAGVVINAVGGHNKKLLIPVLSIIICVFAVAVVKRNFVWRDSYSLWTDTLRKIPNSSRAHNNLGIDYWLSGRISDALSEYKEALTLKPDYPDAHNNLGNVYAKIGRIDDAVSEYKEALTLKPDYPDVHSNLGAIYDGLGLTEDAISEYKKALYQKPEHTEAHYNLGRIYAKIGRMADAVTEYKQALALKPSSPEVHNNLGLAFENMGYTENAITEYKQALTLKPDYPLVRYNLGVIYMKLGRSDDAISEYEDAIRLNPDFPGAYFDLGNAYITKGLQDKAQWAFENALRLNPDDTEARQALKLLGEMKR